MAKLILDTDVSTISRMAVSMSQRLLHLLINSSTLLCRYSRSLESGSTKLFRSRKAAAQAILECGAAELPDQDSFLAQIIFGYALRRPTVSLKDAVVAMAKSRSLEALEKGVGMS
jgi:hypothetical protein